jgi:hypothetical protein
MGFSLHDEGDHGATGIMEAKENSRIFLRYSKVNLRRTQSHPFDGALCSRPSHLLETVFPILEGPYRKTA